MRISDWSSDVCSSDLSAEVKIERMPHVAEAAKADSANQQQSSQQQGSQGANAWANNGQNMAQSQGQAQGQGRWRPEENSAFAAKNSGDPAVLNHDELRHAGNLAARARYACRLGLRGILTDE